MCQACGQLCCESNQFSGCGCNDCPTEACHGRSDDSDERDDNRDGDAPPPMEVSLCDGAEMKRSRPK